MTPETLALLLRVARGEVTPKTGVTGVTGVTDPEGYASTLPELRRLRQLRVKSSKFPDDAKAGVTEGVTSAPEADETDIIEREGMASGGVPSAYLRGWAMLQTYPPLGVSPETWQGVVNDTGRFLDRWGREADRFGWSSDELFQQPHGLVWKLSGGRVEALGINHARMDGGRLLARREG
jgi:hypothetical protein